MVAQSNRKMQGGRPTCMYVPFCALRSNCTQSCGRHSFSLNRRVCIIPLPPPFPFSHCSILSALFLTRTNWFLIFFPPLSFAFGPLFDVILAPAPLAWVVPWTRDTFFSCFDLTDLTFQPVRAASPSRHCQLSTTLMSQQSRVSTHILDPNVHVNEGSLMEFSSYLDHFARVDLKGRKRNFSLGVHFVAGHRRAGGRVVCGR